jgi:peptide/nickel transport system substrate-binding protein
LKGSSNFIGFANAEVDRLIEQLDYESNEEARLAAYHRIHRIIYEEAPYTFLYTPKATLVYHDRVHNLFIPSQRQDLIAGADVTEPFTDCIWIGDKR